nr:MAG TPA: hypothetical protein [Caudoviricetes sp.]
MVLLVCDATDTHRKPGFEAPGLFLNHARGRDKDGDQRDRERG